MFRFFNMGPESQLIRQSLWAPAIQTVEHQVEYFGHKLFRED